MLGLALRGDSLPTGLDGKQLRKLAPKILRAQTAALLQAIDGLYEAMGHGIPGAPAFGSGGDERRGH